jgi:hypothetical protein
VSIFNKQIKFTFTTNDTCGQDSTVSPARDINLFSIFKIILLLLFVYCVHLISMGGASAMLDGIENGFYGLYRMVRFTCQLLSFMCVCAYVFFTVLSFFIVLALYVFESFAASTGLTRLVHTAFNNINALAQPLSTSETTKQSLLFSFDRDLDFFTSTDFEDLLVFTLDVLELLWQDVNLLIELCGENAFFVGLGLGFMGFS